MKGDAAQNMSEETADCVQWFITNKTLCDTKLSNIINVQTFHQDHIRTLALECWNALTLCKWRKEKYDFIYYFVYLNQATSQSITKIFFFNKKFSFLAPTIPSSLECLKKKDSFEIYLLSTICQIFVDSVFIWYSG